MSRLPSDANLTHCNNNIIIIILGYLHNEVTYYSLNQMKSLSLAVK